MAKQTHCRARRSGRVMGRSGRMKRVTGHAAACATQACPKGHSELGWLGWFRCGVIDGAVCKRSRKLPPEQYPATSVALYSTSSARPAKTLLSKMPRKVPFRSCKYSNSLINNIFYEQFISRVMRAISSRPLVSWTERNISG